MHYGFRFVFKFQFEEAIKAEANRSESTCLFIFNTSLEVIIHERRVGMENNRLEEILEVIEGMPKYEWDRIVQEVNKAYSHKTVKVELDSHSCEVIKKSLS